MTNIEKMSVIGFVSALATSHSNGSQRDPETNYTLPSNWRYLLEQMLNNLTHTQSDSQSQYN